MTERSDWLPCPFCGSNDLKSGGDDKIVVVWCMDCGAHGPNHYGSHIWDDRADRLAEAEAEVKRLGAVEDDLWRQLCTVSEQYNILAQKHPDDARAALTDTASAERAEALSTEYIWGDEERACDAGDVRRRALEEAAEAAFQWIWKITQRGERVTGSDAARIRTHIRALIATPATPTVEAGRVDAEKWKRLAVRAQWALQPFSDTVNGRDQDGRLYVIGGPTQFSEQRLVEAHHAYTAIRRALSQQEGGENG